MKRRFRFNLLHLTLLFFLAFSLFYTSNSLIKQRTKSVSVQAKPQLFFPKDHASHPGFRSEWWYLNLVTRSVDLSGNSKDLAHLISFSRIFGNYGLLTSRFEEGIDVFSEKTDSGGLLTVELLDNKYLNINYRNDAVEMHFQQIPNKNLQYILVGKSPQVGVLKLILDAGGESNSKTKPLLWGGSGRISVFEPNDTFYYSFPDLNVSGSITDVDGKQRTVVTGKAWFDHQWFSSSPPSNWKGHYWLSSHFAYNPDPLALQAHQSFGFVTQIYEEGPKYTYWVMRDSGGNDFYGNSASLTPITYYSNGYPSRLIGNLRNDAGEGILSFNVIPTSSNQVFSPPIGPSFFEPAVYFLGTNLIDMNKTFYGVGFFETHLKSN